MRLARRLATWWKAVTRPARLDAEIEDELAFHIESRTEDLMRGGLSREAATRRARTELGGIVAQKEQCRSAWGTRAWDELRLDLRYAFRTLAKSPAFTAIAIGSLALGIGANTAIFTVAKGLLLDRLSVPRPHQLRLLAWTQGKNGIVHDSWGSWDTTPAGRTTSTSFSYPVYQQLRQQNQAVQEIFAFKDLWRLTATVDNRAEAVSAEMVSGNYYQVLGVKPVLGRPILDSDDGAVGSGPVVLISDGYWARSFGRSPGIVGKTIELNARPVTIVGINPPKFTGVGNVQNSPDIFFPLSMQPVIAPKPGDSLLTDTKMWWVLMMGRLNPDISSESARASLDVALNAAVRATTTVGKGEEVPRLELPDGSRGENYAGSEFAKPVYVLMSLAGFVLLLACANLANLLLARASARQREISVRLALGAGRARILRQMFTESLLLSFAGGAAGLLLGYLGRNAIPHLLSASWEPSVVNTHFDWKTFGFTALISITAGLLFGLAPAWQSTKAQVSAGLKDNAQTVTRAANNFAVKALVVIQISLSLLLLVGAGLFVRTLINLNRSHLGFNPDHILLFDLQAPTTRYPAMKSIALYRQLEEKLAAIPGVDSVSLSQGALISNSRSSHTFSPDGQSQKPGDPENAYFNAVGEHFFSTLTIPLIGGRSFDETDTETSPKVAVINQKLAKMFFPNSNPIGRTFRAGDHDHPQHVAIVGICKDAKYDSLRNDVPPTYYVPYRQQGGEEGMTFEIHTRMKPDAIVPGLRNAVSSIDKDLPLLDIRSQIEQIDDTTKQERIFASLTSGFGLLALVLACIGVYGITAYSVARRTNEIGIRMALGAQSGRVLRMVLGEASYLAILGVVAGLGLALSIGRFIASMLYGLEPYDPLTLAGAALLVFFIALVASWIPARRAARITPMEALRHE